MLNRAHLIRLFFLALVATLTLPILLSFHSEWGFFGHRRINRMATFTLPPEMMVLYRPNIDYITEHAVDPDKRRYATRHEAVRHYIDIDHWGEYPFSDIPRDWVTALLYKAEIQIQSLNDTISIEVDSILTHSARRSSVYLHAEGALTTYGLNLEDYRKFWQEYLMGQYYEDEWVLDCEILSALLGGLPGPCDRVQVIDHFSEYGIIPYHLVAMQKRLTRAFEQRDGKRVIQISAEMGHYIGDAHVPLHTTENYNGQLTGQVGIHGFWESRIPELFADDEYDYFVGKATYISNPQDYYWEVVLASHVLVDSVLNVERRLRETFPSDRQFCFEDRLDINIRTQCPEFAKAFSDAMEGMVEARMRQAILAIGSAWYTAWIDAGQPDLRTLLNKVQPNAETQQELEQQFRAGEIKGREHSG